MDPSGYHQILKDMTKPKEWHGMTAVVMGNIVFRKLLEAATDPNVPFEVIEETVHKALKAPVCMRKDDVLNTFQTFGKQVVLRFF